MRKLKLAPLFMLVSVFGLSACTLPSWLSFLSFIPGLEAPEKEEKEEEKKEEEEEEEEEQSKYTATGIMEDICEFAWGGVEEGDLEEPDEDGVVTCNYVIGFNSLEGAEDSDTFLSGLLSSLPEDEDFPSYLSIAAGPVYQANVLPVDESGTTKIGVSQAYFQTDDEAFIVWMYDYFYEGSTSIYFECGPAAAYAE